MALKLIRDNLKSLVWVIWIVIFAFVVLVFFEWGGFTNQQAAASTQVAATVGDQEITYNEVQSYHRQLENQYKQMFGDQFTPEMIKQFNLPMQALNQLINQRILAMEAREIGIEVTDEDIASQIQSYPTFQRNGRFIGAEEYEAVLKRNRIQPADFHAGIREELLLGKLDAILASTAYVSDADVEKAYRDQVEKAQIRFLQLPAANMDEVTVEPSELEAYLADHSADFEIPEQRVVDYLLVDTNKLRQEIELSEEEIRAYYDSNSALYTREGTVQPFEQVQAGIRARLLSERSNTFAQEKALDMASRVTSEMTDESIQTLAEEEGVEVITTAPFGVADTVEGLGRSLTFNQTAFDMAEVGGVSEPVRVPRGFAIMKLREIKQPRSPAFAEVQDKVKEVVVAERRKEAALARLQSAVTSGTSLDDLATELSVEAEESAEFGRGGTIANLGRQAEIVEAALSLDAGQIGGPFKTETGAVLFEVTQRTKFDAAEFESAKEETRTTQEQQRLRELKQMLVEKRRRELPPNFNPDIFERFDIEPPVQG